LRAEHGAAERITPALAVARDRDPRCKPRGLR